MTNTIHCSTTVSSADCCVPPVWDHHLDNLVFTCQPWHAQKSKTRACALPPCPPLLLLSARKSSYNHCQPSQPPSLGSPLLWRWLVAGRADRNIWSWEYFSPGGWSLLTTILTPEPDRREEQDWSFLSRWLLLAGSHQYSLQHTTPGSDHGEIETTALIIFLFKSITASTRQICFVAGTTPQLFLLGHGTYFIYHIY